MTGSGFCSVVEQFRAVIDQGIVFMLFPLNLIAVVYSEKNNP
jgi:hypothetical protein